MGSPGGRSVDLRGIQPSGLARAEVARCESGCELGTLRGALHGPRSDRDTVLLDHDPGNLAESKGNTGAPSMTSCLTGGIAPSGSDGVSRRYFNTSAAAYGSAD